MHTENFTTLRGASVCGYCGRHHRGLTRLRSSRRPEQNSFATSGQISCDEEQEIAAHSRSDEITVMAGGVRQETSREEMHASWQNGISYLLGSTLPWRFSSLPSAQRYMAAAQSASTPIKEEEGYDEPIKVWATLRQRRSCKRAAEY